MMMMMMMMTYISYKVPSAEVPSAVQRKIKCMCFVGMRIHVPRGI